MFLAAGQLCVLPVCLTVPIAHELDDRIIHCNVQWDQMNATIEHVVCNDTSLVLPKQGTEVCCRQTTTMQLLMTEICFTRMADRHLFG